MLAELSREIRVDDDVSLAHRLIRRPYIVIYLILRRDACREACCDAHRDNGGPIDVVHANSMGKIKNRDAKKAAAKVFSSGGGGGTKGPAVIDKRNQELKCPHCDRVFKQTGRLNDHVKKQHPTEIQEDESVAVTSTGGSSSAGGSREAPGKQLRIMDVGSKGGAYDYKSPKLILHEMLLRDKAPKPRYVPVSRILIDN